VAHFDVHRNPGRRAAAIPYLASLQNARFDRAASRFVAPLVLVRTGGEAHYLAPLFTVEGRHVFLDVFNLATLGADRLGETVASLTSDEDRTKIIRAIDELISQA